MLGAKNIKAIAISGSKRTEWAHPAELTALSKSLSKKSFGPATAKYRELGTATNLLTFNRFGALPTRNFQSGTFEEAVNLSPEQLGAVRSKTRKSCMAWSDPSAWARMRGRPGGKQFISGHRQSHTRPPDHVHLSVANGAEHAQILGTQHATGSE